jgi:hypothetical protein
MGDHGGDAGCMTAASQYGSSARKGVLEVYRYEHAGDRFSLPVRKELQTTFTWPTLEQIEKVNRENPVDLKKYPGLRGEWEHLVLAINADAAMDWMYATGWPNEIVRSEEDEKRNGKLVQGKEIGYDYVAHVRGWLTKMGYEDFSLAEVLRAAGHPGAGRASSFLSHVQSELVSDTMVMLAQVGEWQATNKEGFMERMGRTFGTRSSTRDPAFVDFHCLRQCKKGAFNRDKVVLCIGEIGFTYFGLTPAPVGKPDNSLFERIWCLYELSCSIGEGCRLWALNPHELALNQSERDAKTPDGITNLDIRSAKATDPKDKEMILAAFESTLGGADMSNRIIKRAFSMIHAASRVRQGKARALYGASSTNGLKLNTGLLDLETGKAQPWLLCGLGCGAIKFVSHGPEHGNCLVFSKGSSPCPPFGGMTCINDGNLCGYLCGIYLGQFCCVPCCCWSRAIGGKALPSALCDPYYGCHTSACWCGRVICVGPNCPCTQISGCGACGFDLMSTSSTSSDASVRNQALAGRVQVSSAPSQSHMQSPQAVDARQLLHSG